MLFVLRGEKPMEDGGGWRMVHMVQEERGRGEDGERGHCERGREEEAESRKERPVDASIPPASLPARERLDSSQRICSASQLHGSKS